jgi:hypothetical protein
LGGNGKRVKSAVESATIAANVIILGNVSILLAKKLDVASWLCYNSAVVDMGTEHWGERPSGLLALIFYKWGMDAY